MCTELTEAQYARIAHLFPRQRGNVQVSNRETLNALLYLVRQGCVWRALPERYGRWHTIYMRLRRWAERGLLEQVWAALLAERLLTEEVRVAALDSTIIQLHQHGAGAPKKRGGRRSGARAAAGRPSCTSSRSTSPPRCCSR